MSKTIEQKPNDQPKRSYAAPSLEARGKLQLVSGYPAGSNLN